MLARVILIIYCIFINFLGIASMAADKIRAMERRFRIPEGVLFTIAISITASLYLFSHLQWRDCSSIRRNDVVGEEC